MALREGRNAFIYQCTSDTKYREGIRACSALFYHPLSECGRGHMQGRVCTIDGTRPLAFTLCG